MIANKDADHGTDFMEHSDGGHAGGPAARYINKDWRVLVFRMVVMTHINFSTVDILVTWRKQSGLLDVRV